MERSHLPSVIAPYDLRTDAEGLRDQIEWLLTHITLLAMREGVEDVLWIFDAEKNRVRVVVQMNDVPALVDYWYSEETKADVPEAKEHGLAIREVRILHGPQLPTVRPDTIPEWTPAFLANLEDDLATRAAGSAPDLGTEPTRL